MSNGIRWASDAEERVKKMPLHLRLLVKHRAEFVATAQGLTEVTSALLDEIEAKERKAMGR